MNNFTYEKGAISTPLETYEWDNVWIQRTDDVTSPRVLYIGDSISCALRMFANDVTKEKILFDSFGTSKALDNPFFYDALHIFASQEKHRDVVLFNNGLHGWHLDDLNEYPEYYEKMLNRFLDEFTDTKVVLVLTTSVADEEREARVKVRNECVMKLSEKYNLDVIDLYAPSVQNANLRGGDGVHFSAEGYRALSEYLVEQVKQILK